MSDRVYPVVVVGKDRTRMTCEVVRNLNEKLKNRDLKFFVVSDRSRKGHVEAIRGFFQRELPAVDFEVLETSSEHFGWGAAMNIGLEKAFQISDSAILVDNDWILQRTILCDGLEDVFSKTPMGCVSFKALSGNRIYNVTQKAYSGYRFDVNSERHHDGRWPGYVVHIGCMAISKRFFQIVGKFQENVNHTDDVERNFIWRYTRIPDVAREANHILFGTFSEFRHFELNGPGHVFTHVGLDSQSGRKQRWGVPEKYLDLSNIQKDIDFCNSAYLKKTALVAIAKDEDRYIDEWIEYNLKIGFDDIFIYQNDWRYSGCCKDPRVHFLVADGYRVQIDCYRKFIKEKHSEYGWAAFFDVDEFLYVNGGKPIGQTLKDFEDRDAIAVSWRVFGDSGILSDNGSRGVLERFRHRGKFYSKFVKNIINLNKAGDRLSFLDPHTLCVASNREELNILDCSGKHRTRFGHIEELVSMDEQETLELFHFRNKTWEECLNRHYGKREGFSGECEKNTNLDVVRKNFDEMNQNDIQDDRAFNIMNSSINWKDYVDGIYCLHFIPQTDKYGRIIEELKRVGIYDSGIFRFQYTSPSEYDKVIFEKEKNFQFCPNIAFVNVCLGMIGILEEAVFMGKKSILFLENDIAFLKDIGEIKQLMSSIPKDADLVQFDKYVGDWNKRMFDEQPQDEFVSFDKKFFTSASCLYLSRKGIEEMLTLMKQHIRATDQIYGMMNCKKYFSRKCLTIQILDKKSNSFKVDGPATMHKVYTNQGIKYSDYSVPEGYEVGSYIENGKVVTPRTSAPEFSVETHSIGEKSKGRKKVSVYAIAYNESKNIEKWMSCVSEADEVVVLDTGSTDDTVEKFRKLGARVEVERFDKWNSVEEYDAIVARGGNPWRFDKARNDSLKLVAEDSDILVTIDIDEFMQPGWRKKLEDQWIAAEESGKHPTCAAYKYVWCYNPDGSEARTFEIHKIHARGVCHWTHMIHEVLHYDSGERPFWLNDFVVEHHQDMTKTRKSYLPMLAVEARDIPENDRSAHYYGRELMYEARWDESIAELKRHLSLKASGWRAERAASMRYIANCYAGKKDSEMEELWLWKAAHEDPHHREASFRLGEIYMSRKDYRQAERAWAFCLNIKERSQEYISDNRCWSAEPHLKYAQALWWNGNWRAACEQAEIAVQLEPSNREAVAQRDGMQTTRQKFNR